jgi:hypothetical protein
MTLTKYDLVVSQVKYMNRTLYDNPNNSNILNLVYKYIEKYKKLNVELELYNNIVRINKIY